LARLSTLIRLLLVLLVVAGIVGAFVFRGSFQPHELKEQIGGHGAAPLVFMALSIATSLVFVPRTVLAAAAGLLFGLWWGLLWTTISSLIGSVLGFLLARYINNGLVDAATLPRLAPVLKAAEQGGWRIVALIRLLPMPNTPVNYALGVTRLSLGSFTLGSLIGMLPSSFVYAELGASGEAALSGRHWIMPTAVALALLALTMLLPRLKVVRRALWPAVD
jgi:uncharacterized membrane protein YdjX (TVP38/TMEM64 family)